MHKLLLTTALLAAIGASPAKAAQINVENVGAVFNQSLALPAQDAPGSGIAFEEFFEFTLPTSETVTVSMSDSAIGSLRVVGGVLSLNTFTSTASTSPFQPIGTLIEASALANVIGGQEATVNPDVLSAGAYFVEFTGTSGSSPIHIAIDGTITAVTTPEPSTWAMVGLGFGFLSLFGMRRWRSARLAI